MCANDQIWFGCRGAEFAGTKPVKALALDPDYVKRSTRELVSGGQDGQLVLKTKGCAARERGEGEEGREGRGERRENIDGRDFMDGIGRV